MGPGWAEIAEVSDLLQNHERESNPICTFAQICVLCIKLKGKGTVLPYVQGTSATSASTMAALLVGGTRISSWFLCRKGDSHFIRGAPIHGARMGEREDVAQGW